MWERINAIFHCDKCTVWGTGITRNSLSCKLLSSNQFRVDFFCCKELFSRNFCEKMHVHTLDTLYSFIFTLWKLRTFTAAVFSQKFRQINVLLNNLTTELFWREKLRKGIFPFPYCDIAQCVAEKRISFLQNNYLVISHCGLKAFVKENKSCYHEIVPSF